MLFHNSQVSNNPMVYTITPIYFFHDKSRSFLENNTRETGLLQNRLEITESLPSIHVKRALSNCLNELEISSISSDSELA